jgi:methylmalonyl-CoA mutase cobalamin-binding subunit
VVGLSILSGSHLTLVAEVISLLEKEGVGRWSSWAGSSPTTTGRR